MKRFNFLPVAIALVLIVTTLSCTTMAGSQDDYYSGRSNRYGDRVYVEDPYRGTVVLERDPRTGRYYEINPYYNGYYGNRVYGTRPYGYPVYGGSPYYGRSNGGYYNGGRSNNNNNTATPTPQRPTENDTKTRDEARKKILGN